MLFLINLVSFYIIMRAKFNYSWKSFFKKINYSISLKKIIF